MKKWLKRWLEIDKIEKVVESPAMLATLRYANDEVTKTEAKIERAIYFGEIENVDCLHSFNNICYRVQTEDDICWVERHYNPNLDTYIYSVKMNYVVIDEEKAEKYFDVVDKRYKLSK